MRDVSKSKAKYEGKVFTSTNSGDFKVIEYIDPKNVVIEFLTTGERAVARIGNVINGKVKDRMYPSVYGVGITGEKIPFVEGERCKQRELWIRMLDRCYSKGKNKPTYEGCSVSDNFKYYPFFKEWCEKQIGFDVKGFALDKDILVKGNKIYSEDTCVFVPQEVNNILTYRKSTNKGLPAGVALEKSGRYSASFRKDRVMQNLGRFGTVEEAFQAYKKAKESYIKEVAEKWKDHIDPRVYKSLMNWTVEIDD